MRKLLIAFLLFISLNSYALDRIALVIGNSDYQIKPLKNPINDAKDIAASLEKLGFEVQLVENADKIKMEKAMREFSLQIQDSITNLFFYAGHAVQLNTKNYLLPINSLKAIKKDLGSLSNYDQIQRFQKKAISTDLLTNLIEAGNSEQNFIFLDACRDNPIPGNTLEGLSEMILGAKGTLISYSTSPGKLASDGKGRNSPYTKQLLKFIKTPNKPIESMLKDVALAVELETNGEQLPWVATNLTSNFCFNDVDDGCAKLVIPIQGIPFLEDLDNISVKNLDNGDRYVGQMKNGIFNGKGVLTYKNGAKYEGDFVDHKKSGYGTLTQSNGNSYKGNFLNDKKHGTGTLNFINGATIGTEWDMGIRIFWPEWFSGVLDERGRFHGAATHYMSNGSKAKGVWNHGVLEGYVEITSSGGGLYKGEYKNGNSHGKGIRLDTDGQIYEGNFVNGQLNGYGSKTWFNGDAYTGEFVNGQMNGQGIILYADGGSIEGEWQDDHLNGKGRSIWANGDRYEGDFLNGRFHGKGIMTMANGDIHNGVFKDGVANGYGELIYKTGGGYKGEFKYNQPHGIGVMDYDSGDRYEGGFDKGLENGYGEYFVSNGDIYRGEFLNGKSHGQGKFTWADGTSYEGQWKDNQMHGQGLRIRTNGEKYDGQFENDKRNGQGTYTWSNGMKYIGEWKDNEMDGYGVIDYGFNKGSYKGDFKNHMRHGKGEIFRSPNISYKGDWFEDNEHGQGVYTLLWTGDISIDTDDENYVGEFQHGSRTGIGKYTWSDGSNYEGEFKNNNKHGKGIFIWADGSRYEVEYQNEELISSIALD